MEMIVPSRAVDVYPRNVYLAPSRGRRTPGTQEEEEGAAARKMRGRKGGAAACCWMETFYQAALEMTGVVINKKRQVGGREAGSE